MKRKAHYLQTVASGAWPAKIIVGHASLERIPLNGEKNIVIDKVANWCIGEIRQSGNFNYLAKEEKGIGGKEFLHSLSAYGVRRKTAIVYLAKAYRVLTAAGFWDAIELGDWCICEKPENDGVSNAEGRSKGWNGTVTASPRCTIICARCVGKPGTIRIVDLANFGLEVSVEPHNFDAGFKRAFNWGIQWHDMLLNSKLGSPQNTSASQAMRAFRCSFLDTPILVHDNLPALALERESVHAGRCECFTLGQVPGEVYHLDSSSHYAGVAIDADIPCRLRAFSETWPARCLPSERPLERMIAEVTIETPDAFYPCCHGLDIVYPVGVFRTVLCGPELVFANNEGHLRKIHRGAVYEMDRPFNKFYATLWAERQKSKKNGFDDLGTSIKAMLSRFHGKWTQRAMSWVNVPSVQPPACFAKWHARQPNDMDTLLQPSQTEIEPWHIDNYLQQQLVPWRSIGWQVQMEVNCGEHRNSVPAVAAWILSLGRVRLLSWMLSAGFHNIHYCDTDSLWTNRAGYERLLGEGHVREGELGYLRLIGMHKRMHIDGLKTYTVDGVPTHGGIPDDATVTESGGHRYYLNTGIADALHRRHLPSAASVLVERNGTGRYRHGTPTAGGRVIPLTGPFDLEAKNANSHRISCTCPRCKPYNRKPTDLH